MFYFLYETDRSKVKQLHHKVKLFKVMNSFKNRYVSRLGLFSLILLLAILILNTSPPFWEKLFSSLDDTSFRIRDDLGMFPHPSSKLIIVAVDEKSVNNMGRWPWSRNVIGKLIGRLQEARIVALDILFSEKSSPEEDSFLANIISENDNVIAGFFLRNQSSAALSDDALSNLEECALPKYETESDTIGLREVLHVETNIPEISDAMLSCAFLSIEPDADGIYRRYPIAFIFKGSIYPSLGIQTARFAMNQEVLMQLDHEGIRGFKLGEIHHNHDNTLRLNFYKNIHYVSAYDALYHLPTSYFSDKIVFIGITEMGLFDMRPSPIDLHAPGIGFHYTAVSNLLNNEFLTQSFIVDISVLLVVLIAVLSISMMTPFYRRLLFNVLVLILLIGIINVLFLYFNIRSSLSLPLMASILLILSLEGLSFFQTEAHASDVKKVFSNYVAPEVVQMIVEDIDNVQLGGEEREVSILFSDIRDFTSISEKLTPSQLVMMLNQYLDPMTNVILEHNGLLDKYIGDAIMAMFNAPLDTPNHADYACRSALEMVNRLIQLNEQFSRDNWPNINIGVGINTGVATVGNIGSKLRFDYTAIGDSVNLAARVEGLNKYYKTQIIVSEFTKECLQASFLLRELDHVKVKGKDNPVRIYELMAQNTNNPRIRSRFEEGLELYFHKRFKEAENFFRSTSDEFNDPTSLVFADRCAQYESHPPPENWDGTYEKRTK